MAGGVGVASWAGVAGIECAVKVAFGAEVPGNCFFELRLLQGGVALRWAGVPASLSTSIGEASIVEVVDAAAAYNREAVEMGVVAVSGGGSGRFCIHRSGLCLLSAFEGWVFTSGWGGEER